MSPRTSRKPALAAPAKPQKGPPGKHTMPALAGQRNDREAALLGALDPDKLNQLAECLFTLNNRRFGPIPGAYVVVCTEVARRWCVGQLSADRARPLIVFEELEFDTPAAATRAATHLRRERGESTPARSI